MATRILLFISITLALSVKARAQQIEPYFQDAREEAMGGAAVAVVDDETSLFINPAGLGKIRGSEFVLANPQLETDYDTQSALTVNNNYTSIGNPQALLAIAEQNPGKNMLAMAEIAPAYIATNFGISAYSRYSIEGLYNSSTGKMQFDYLNDDGAVIGYCFRLFEGRLKIGVDGKVINRVYADQSIAQNATNLSLGSLVSEGDGVGWDAGALLTAPWKFLPTLGVAAHDIGNTYFTMGNGIFYKPGTIPPPQEQSVDVSAAIFPIFSSSVRSSWTVQYNDVANIDSAAWYRAFHAGVEVDIGDTLYLRGGMNELYYTAGLEFDFGHNQLQLTTYGEDIGTDTSPQEDRRFMFMYGLRF